MGSVAAAWRRPGLVGVVILSEETDWLGGQLTQQAVPPDEHPWIESFGCTASYRQLANGGETTTADTIHSRPRRWPANI